MVHRRAHPRTHVSVYASEQARATKICSVENTLATLKIEKGIARIPDDTFHPVHRENGKLYAIYTRCAALCCWYITHSRARRADENMQIVFSFTRFRMYVRETRLGAII